MNRRRLPFVLLPLLLSAHLVSFAQRAQPPAIDQCELRRNIVYPDDAEQRGVEGSVELRVEVAADGSVSDVEIVKADDSSLADGARQGVLRARFRPATDDDDEPTAGTTTLRIGFEMDPLGTERMENGYDAVIRAGFGKIYVRPAADSARSFGGPERANSANENVWPTWDEFVPVEREPNFDMGYIHCMMVYPEAALQDDISGRVTVRVLVDTRGRPREARVERSSDAIFNESAVAAIMKSRFVPAARGSGPVNCWISIPLTFRTN